MALARRQQGPLEPMLTIGSFRIHKDVTTALNQISTRGTHRTGSAETVPSIAAEWPPANCRQRTKRNVNMKYAGLLVMPAGFFLTIAALALFPDPARRLAFVLCGLAVIGMGLVVAVRGHMLPRGENRP